VEPGSYGAALQYFTGSKAHNVRVREMAKKKGLKVSEYGVFKGEKKIGGRDEEDIYKAIGIPMMPPEIREDWGEIEAAEKGKLPALVQRRDIRGDLHVHSKYSDGVASIAEIARKAGSLGYAFVAICDHSRAARYAGGLEPRELLRQMEEIRKVNAGLGQTASGSWPAARWTSRPTAPWISRTTCSRSWTWWWRPCTAASSRE